MTLLDHRDVLLYIKSEDIVVRVLPPDAADEAIRSLRANGHYSLPPGQGYSGHWGTGSFFDAGRFGNKPVRAKELPEGEEDAIRRVWAAVQEKGKRLHIVDVGKESALRRVIGEHLHHLQNFPVLVRLDGRRLEGVENFTEAGLEKFLSD
jgi:hypothetical protein